MRTEKKQAIVIGGSIAGLLAARVLADHFEKVTIIERDMYPQFPTHRAGVPQDRQLHTMMLRGQRELERLFPGLGQKLLSQGAIPRNYGSESLYYYGGRCPRIPPVLRGWNCSRLLLEWQIRQELMEYRQLNILEGYEVAHLLFDQYTSLVNGVQYRARNHHKSTENEIHDMVADLVIDASGSSSLAPQWLKEGGYDAPSESIVDVSLGYASCLYQPPAQFQADWRGITVHSPQRSRGGVLMEIEGDRWIVVLSGVGKDYPPTEPDAYLEFAQSLPEQELYRAMKEASPISSVYGYRRTANRLRHFGRLKRFPEQFFVIGDAACAFNPVYGQGMTVAALEAVALEEYLKKKQRNHKWFARSFQKKVARIVARPWQLATSFDAQLMGEKTERGVMKWYMERVAVLLLSNSKVLITFLEVMHMLRSPFAFFHPTIVLDVIRPRQTTS